ncbi:MAG: acyl-CoA carboxylase subunit epsilon [Nocardioidaceae bacterium]
MNATDSPGASAGAVPGAPPERDGQPWLRVVKGEPSAEELAALVAVLASRGPAAAARLASVRRSSWSDPRRRLRRPLHASAGGWRASASPH